MYEQCKPWVDKARAAEPALGAKYEENVLRVVARVGAALMVAAANETESTEAR